MARVRAVTYSAGLIWVKPKALRRNGIYITAAVRMKERSIDPKR